MATPAKQAAIAELTEQFRESGAAVLTEYRGLSVAQLSRLRTSLGELSATTAPCGSRRIANRLPSAACCAGPSAWAPSAIIFCIDASTSIT